MHTVADIMTPGVITIPSTTPVYEAKGVFVNEKISGAPIVDYNGNIEGIVSIYDIIHFESTGGDIESAQLFELATRNIVSTTTNTSIASAARLMVEKKVHRLVVYDGLRLAGFLSTFDFVKYCAEHEQ